MPELPPTRGEPPRPKTPRASLVAVRAAESGGDVPVKPGGRRDGLLRGSLVANGILCFVILVLGIALIAVAGNARGSGTDWPEWWVRTRAPGCSPWAVQSGNSYAAHACWVSGRARVRLQCWVGLRLSLLMCLGRFAGGMGCCSGAHGGAVACGGVRLTYASDVPVADVRVRHAPIKRNPRVVAG